MIGTTLRQRYRIDAELGSGGMSKVYRAHDLLLDRDVAIKVVGHNGLGSEGQTRLLREAQAVAQLNDPNIVSVYDAGEVDGSPFIVMELIEGHSLREVKGLSLAEALRIVAQICAALEHAHSHNIIHRDLKPENVMLLDPHPVPLSFEAKGGGMRVKLMDFGLARSAHAERITQEGTIIGTLSYIAPELILGELPTPQSDLYSLGVMLYELAAGRPPFMGDTLMAVVSQHLYAPVVPPSTYNASLLPVLDALIMRLLEKEYDDRPASAGEVRQVLESLDQPSAAPLPDDAAKELPILDRIARGRLVGRQTELDQLHELWQNAEHGQGHLALLSGEPGIGKTRLANEVIAYAQMTGASVMRGGCYEYEAAMPYLPVAEALREWVAAQTIEELRARLGSMAYELSKLVPEIEVKIGPITPNPPLPPNEERLRLFDHIARFLQYIASERGLLLFVDDLHWADHGTLALLHYLLRRLRHERVLILGAYREVELDRAHPLAGALVEWHKEHLSTRVPLERLSSMATGELLAALFGQASVSADFAEVIHRETEGNPFFIEEVVKSLIEQGQIYREGDRWQRRDTGELTIPQSIKEAIGRRLCCLTDACLDILHAAAAIGKIFSFAELSIASSAPEDQLLDALDAAGSAQLIRANRDDEFIFTHDKIREVLYEELNPIRRRRLHQRIGEGLEKLYAADLEKHVQDLAHHFIESGDLPRGLQYSMQTGAKAARLFALDEALNYYERAIECAETLNLPERLAAIHEAIGDIYSVRGPFQNAIEAYQHALALAGAREKRAELKTRIGATYAYVGDERGLEFLHAALGELNPDTQTNQLAHATASIGRFYHYRLEIDQAIEYLERARQIAEPIDDAATLSDIYAYLAGAYQQGADVNTSMEWSKRAIEMGERKSYPHAVAIGYEFLAEDHFILGQWQAALAYAARDREIGEKIGAQSRIGWAEASCAYAHHGLGDLHSAQAAANTSAAIAERIGDTRIAVFVRAKRAEIESELGQDEAAQADIDFALARAAETGLRQIYGWTFSALAAVYVHGEKWEQALQLASEYESRLNVRPLSLYAIAYLGLGRMADVNRIVEEDAATAHDRERPSGYAWRLRLRGQIAAAQGQYAEAAALLDQSLSLFEQLSSQLEIGRTLYQRGLLRLKTNEVEAAQADLARARSIFAARGAVRDLARVEKISAM